MDIIKRSKGVIEGADAKTVFRAANIRSWPMEEMPTMGGRHHGIESEGSVSSGETLHTAQSQLHAPTVRKYMTEGAPATDPSYGNEIDNRYLPEVLSSERGRKWVDEGHHRLVASRLRGEPSTEVYKGYIGQ